MQGAFKKFLCSNQDPDQLPFTNTECSDLEGKIVLRTSKSTIRLALSDVDDNGVPLSMAPFGNILPQVCPVIHKIKAQQSSYIYPLDLNLTTCPKEVVSWLDHTACIVGLEFDMKNAEYECPTRECSMQHF